MTTKASQFFGAEDPESFENEELTTEQVRELAQDEDQESQRQVGRKRRSGAGVEDPRKSDRGHTSTTRLAAQAQKSKRENPIAWRPAASLDAPPAPPGMVLRWVRGRLGDRDDPRNLSKKFREGWKPYLTKDAPEDYSPPETFKTKLGEVIAVGDLILCMMPRELYKQRQAYFRQKTLRQKGAVQDRVKSQIDPRLPLHTVEEDTYSRGRRPAVQGEEG